MHSIADHELDALTTADLVQRMDTFLRTAHIERYGPAEPQQPPPPFPPLPPEPCVSDVVNAKTLVSQSDLIRRRVAYATYAYLVQMQFNSVCGGFANRILYDESYNETKWQSPVFRLRDGALRQYETISSRIAFEVFIDLLYVIENGKRIESKKSKLKAFRSWLLIKRNRFHYFAHVLLEAYRFDRELRTPEVHGTSRLPRRMLRLELPSHDENNEHLQLINVLSGVWRPLIDILNDVRPTYMHMKQSDEAWFHAFMSGDDEAIEAKLANMFDEFQ